MTIPVELLGLPLPLCEKCKNCSAYRCLNENGDLKFTIRTNNPGWQKLCDDCLYHRMKEQAKCLD